MYKWILIFLLIPSVCFGAEITTARGTITINNGDTVYKNSMWEGQIEGLEDVTFIGWNFSRQEPHTVVFVKCKNLIFIDCNLVNVEMQEDFIIDGSLIMHKRKYSELGIDKEDIEYKDGKTKTYSIDKDGVKTLLTAKDTLDEKKIKVKKVHPNTRVISNLNTISVIR